MTVKGEIVDGVRGARVEFGTVTSSNPASIGAGAVGTATLTITGLDTTDLVFLNPRGIGTGLVMLKSTVTGTDTVTVTLYNPTAGAVDDGASDYDYVLIKRAD
jgi:hypothetical protein